MAVNVLESSESIKSKRDNCRLWQVFVMGQKCGEIAPGAVLGHHPKVTLRVVPTMECSHVGVMELAQSSHLIDQLWLA
eukprot:scaffold161318_cov34-Tisochrysis_lutea.AAC.9